ncbi:MAG: class I SAM-dependent methyltransferase [bacterium]|nr:class I SAM-dependent methyltransferase [bacterium]
MDNYDAFAPFYDTILGVRKERVVEFITPLLQKHAPKATSLLEIACGTGNIMGEYKDTYEVAGLDLSPCMIKVAKEKFPDVDVRVETMTEFDFGRSFDIIICLFDSINHLASFEEWEQTFASAHKHLNTGGILLFDMNTKAQFDRYRGRDPLGRQYGNDFVIMEEVDGENDMESYSNFKIFAQGDDGKYTMHEEHLRERTYPMAQVSASLDSLFSSVSIYTEKGKPVSDTTERLYFVCEK